MKMDRRLSNGLAWAGALLVIGIPAADYITGTFAGDTPRVAVVEADPAAVTANPAVTAEAPTPVPAAKPQAVANTSDAVGGFIQSGKPLPSYITGGGSETEVAVTPAPQPTPAVQQPAQPSQTQTAVARPPIATTPAPAEQVAVLPPKAAPMPMPLSMRPHPVTVPLASNQPLIIDEAAVQPLVPVQPLQPQPQPLDEIITAEDLESWEAGPLSEFLERRGQQSSATYRVQQNQADYDPDGFWLDEGPSGNMPIRRLPDTEEYYLPF